MGPGQPRLDSGSPQQAGFPYQVLSEGFWAATHLPLAVRLQNPFMEHELCHVHTEHCFSGQTGHHEHRRQEVTDAITRTTKYLMVTTTYKHTVDATDRGVSLPCHSCLDV